ncbi:DinB family protein [Nocardia caishijiensis]|uniref:DinB family protein n=1 Tax=Nocardia caishijiensis TaxID=184756 RepID=A0ABQ6YJ04_9NOCA|nr:DinB family protein [Nocardia caishijiensis]KAF0845706.1 DinB family protein [Nocardia caishijiensis]
MIVPDTKDWTWVLEKPCAECGYDAASIAFEQVPDRARAAAARIASALDRDDVRVRPDARTWSVLEYAAHVRDVCRIFVTRLALMQDGGGTATPRFENWDQDATAVADRYGEQDPAVVARELSLAADQVAADFAAVPTDRLDWRGARSDGSLFTVSSLARYFLHDLEHHVHDVRG